MACAPVALLRALDAVRDRDLPGGEVAQRARDAERADAARALLVQDDGGVGDRLEAANAGPDHHASAFARLDIVLAGRPARVGDRLVGGGHGVEDELVDAPAFLGGRRLVGIEGVRIALAAAAPCHPGHLRGDAAGQVRGVEGVDRTRAGLALQQA